MGKIFSNSDNNPQNLANSYSTNHGSCRQACCHSHNSCGSHGHGCINPYSSESGYPAGSSHVNRPCFGQCNPPKLYADTYNYLNEKLMQPVVKEVYHDLNTISPANTVMNNPIASQIGLPLQSGQTPLNNLTQNIPSVNNPAKIGMGPEIINMVMGSSGNKPKIQESHIAGQVPSSPSRLQGASAQQGFIDGPSAIGDGNRIPLNGNVNRNEQNVYQNIIPNVQMSQVAVPQLTGNPTNPGIQQLTKHHAGPHDQGITKFNEMFPGVMQGLGGDLNFDPMAIAIQMNPENQQKAVINAMHKAIVDNTEKMNHPQLSALNQAPPPQLLQPTTDQNPATATHQLPQTMIETNVQLNENANVLEQNKPGIQQENIKEPIFPIDTSKHQSHREYNTLGQPVEMLPAKLFHSPAPSLPQTLAPQPTTGKFKNDCSYKNIKSTVSKTSIIGHKSIGKIPSKNQLQHIYNQYKGSQSHTQQNVQEHLNVTSASEGRLRTAQTDVHHQALVEKEGGDVSRNNPLQPKRLEATFEQGGDASINKLGVPEKVCS